MTMSPAPLTDAVRFAESTIAGIKSYPLIGPGFARAGLASLLLSVMLGASAPLAAQTGGESPNWPEHIQLVLDTCKPLDHPREQRLPLYLWPAMNPGPLSDRDAERLVGQLNERGVGLVCRWHPGRREQTLAEAAVVARAQKKLGLPVNVDATACLYSFFNGDERTAHVDDAGHPFWDDSFGKKNMGCPLAIDFRRPAIREQVEYFVQAYRRQDLPLDFVFADWEIDGPIEWNDAWSASKRCRRCREGIGDLDNFLAFQKTLRDLRSDLQKEVYAQPVLDRFPRALVGNYAVCSHDGFRYWYDYFEKYVEGQPAIADQRARYRHWANEFEGTGYTFAMPVVYTWASIYHWYDFEVPDYRWFYAMLREASSVAANTLPSVPIITFVHWHTTAPPKPPDQTIRQMSEWAYQELLWHMLLRGVDAFFLWCPPAEQRQEVELLHPVWAQAQEYGDFLDHGTPVCFDVPARPGTVVSGLRWGERVLVRRTDFTPSQEAVTVKVDSARLHVPPAPGKCQILTLSLD